MTTEQKFLKFEDIPKLKGFGHHRYDVSLAQLTRMINCYVVEDGLDLAPDFQRGHVWTEKQQVEFVEFMLRGGRSPEILLNHPGWKNSFTGNFVLVDGLQRLTALMAFLDGNLLAFGGYVRSQIEGIDVALRGIYLPFYINDLPTRAEVLEWYLELNSGGTVHTQDELDRVKSLLENESKRRND